MEKVKNKNYDFKPIKAIKLTGLSATVAGLIAPETMAKKRRLTDMHLLFLNANKQYA